MHVLIVDDEETICWSLQRRLEEDGFSVTVAASAEEALRHVSRQPPDVVVMDVRLPGMDGLTAMRQMHERHERLPIVIMTAFGDLNIAVGAISGGAIDYLVKPFDLEQAAAVVRHAGRRSDAATEGGEGAADSRDSADGAPGVREFLGRSPAMQEVFKRIAIVAQSDIPVLISGESGTGKELVARAIHRHSRRATKPFVTVNLAALSPTLVESELFGHVKGAFTGADAARTGLLELAHDATVFFDEAGDIPPNVQVKLLRVLEQKEVTPVGDTRSRKTDFRAIAATHHDLARSIQEGTFRRDLYFRLAGFEINLPPLRERPDDIPLLVEHFLRQLRQPTGDVPTISESAMRELQRRPWPGNIRELRSAVEHAAILARGRPIETEHLPPPRSLASGQESSPEQLQRLVRDWARQQLADESRRGQMYDALLALVEPPLFETVLEATSQNRAAAADILGIHRQTLRRRSLKDEADGRK